MVTRASPRVAPGPLPIAAIRPVSHPRKNLADVAVACPDGDPAHIRQTDTPRAMNRCTPVWPRLSLRVRRLRQPAPRKSRMRQRRSRRSSRATARGRASPRAIRRMSAPGCCRALPCALDGLLQADVAANPVSRLVEQHQRQKARDPTVPVEERMDAQEVEHVGACQKHPVVVPRGRRRHHRRVEIIHRFRDVSHRNRPEDLVPCSVGRHFLDVVVGSSTGRRECR